MMISRHVTGSAHERLQTEVGMVGCKTGSGAAGKEDQTMSCARASGRDVDVAAGARLDGGNSNASMDDAKRWPQFVSSSLRVLLDGLRRPPFPPGPRQYCRRCRPRLQFRVVVIPQMSQGKRSSLERARLRFVDR
jgi:hypothetical protein